MGPRFGETEIGGYDNGFKTTTWGLVVSAGVEKDPYWLRQALDRLIGLYWRPIYAFVRKEGYPVEDAKDLVQGFFASLIERQSFERVSPEKGRFRTFLLASLKHYLSDHRDRERAQKRGGGQTILSLDPSEEETLLTRDLSDETPEAAFEKSWALAAVRSAYDRLKAEFEDSARGSTYQVLEKYLHLDYAPETVSYSEGATALGVTLNNFRVMLHRARARFKSLLSEEVLQTVEDPSDSEDELMAVMAGIR